MGALFFVGMVILVFSYGNTGSQQESSAYSASLLTANVDSFDFDTISMANGNVSHEFEIKNEGEEPVIIEKVYTSCMCTTAFITDNSGKKYGKFGMQGHGASSKTSIEIKSGEVVYVEAIFDPAAHGPSGVGEVRRIIYLETNSRVKPKIQLTIEASVIN